MHSKIFIDSSRVISLFAVIRVRGSVNVRKDVEDTLKMLRLHRVNHCVLVSENPQYLGMLKKVKDWVTFGKVDKKTVILLFEKRGMLTGRRKLDEKSLKRITKYETFEKFVDDLMKGKIKLKDYPEIKPVFRLNPPRKGYKAIRLPYPMGDLGNRGGKISELIERMV
ncbi:MAG: 50S ribosomal protein L30 [Candidatus Aenigmatarchaeota archaeon]